MECFVQLRLQDYSWKQDFEADFTKKVGLKILNKAEDEYYHQSAKQVGSRSDPTFYRAWSWSKLFACFNLNVK